MELKLTRINDNGMSTTGILEVEDLKFVTIEDTDRYTKVHGKTCIPASLYEIKLRTEGIKHEQYKKKFPSFHKGMLWLQDVPEFQYILIHIGNSARDSMGCVLVGNKKLNDNYITGSTNAYINLYTRVVKAFERDEQVFLTIVDKTK